MTMTPSGVRHACRRLASTPFLSLGAIAILALGIGSAVVMADVLDRVLLRAPAQVSEPDRAARVYVGMRSFRAITAYSTLEALATMDEELQASAAYFTEGLSLGRGEHARQLESVAYSPDYFAVLGVQPLLGSWETGKRSPREDAAVISHALWQQEFGGSPGVLGKPLHLGVDTFTIVAVAPRGFAGIDFQAPDVWLPLAARGSAAFGPNWKTSNAVFLQTIARLRPGVTRERASERATALYRATRTNDWERKHVLVLGDLRSTRAPGAHPRARVEVLVAAMSIVVLLITCGNVANLLLVRGFRRDREFVVKTALGASRGQLVREVLLEAALLAAGAGAAALVVVTTGGALLRRELLPTAAALSSAIDGRLVLLTVGFCLVAAFLLGVAPAFRLTARRTLNPAQSTTLGPARLLDWFSGAQVALALPLIVAAALFVLSLLNARQQDFGMQMDGVSVVTVDMGEVGRPLEMHGVHRRIQERVASLPQVEATALVQSLPMQHTTSFVMEVPGKDLSGSYPFFNGVDPSFFALMRMRLVDGRFFTDEDNRQNSPRVAVITESMARTIWFGESAIGKCFYVGRRRENGCTEVVGIVADARLFPSIRPTSRGTMAYYVPIEQHSAATTQRALLIRTAAEPGLMLQTLRRASQAAASDLPYVVAHPLDLVFRNLLRPWRIGSIVFVIFGALSLLIASVGVAMVGAYAVARRRREIGIRSALGARPQQLVQLVLVRSLLVVISGLAVGLGLAWVSGRLLDAQLFDVAAGDPRVLVGAAFGLLTIGAIAAWVPARRAARVDPVTALRVE